MPFAAALSTHPVSSVATGELIGQVIEELGSHPDVALLLATPGHAGALEDIAEAVRRLLGPTLLIGTTAPALAGQGADERGGPAMGLWAGITGPIQPIRLPGELEPPGFPVSGAVVVGRDTAIGEGVLPQARPVGPEWLVGPAGIPGSAWGGGEALIGALSGPPLDGRAVGALSSSGPLLLDDRRLVAGAVGVVFGPGVRFEAVTATDWRPIGPALSVTESDPARGLVLGLDGVPALERLHRLATDEVPAEEIEWINRRLGLGPEPAERPGTLGDEDPAASVVAVQGGDRSNGAIAAGVFPPGSRVRFWVGGDPETGLRRALSGRAGDSALVFTPDPTARGYPPAAGGYAGDPAGSVAPVVGHRDVRPADASPADAQIVADALGLQRVLGLVAASQIGPSRGRLGLHRRDVTMALLSDPSPGL